MIPVVPANEGGGDAGFETRSGEPFSLVDLEQRVPTKHPLRKIRQLACRALRRCGKPERVLPLASQDQAEPSEDCSLHVLDHG